MTKPANDDAADVVYVLAGGDLVVATASAFVADGQYLAMVAANLDVERWTVPVDRWVEVRAALAAMHPAPTLTDLTAGE